MTPTTAATTAPDGAPAAGAAAGPGPVDGWLVDTVAALQSVGVTVTATTDVAGATPDWVARTAALAPWDRLQVAVVPWDAPVVDVRGPAAPSGAAGPAAPEAAAVGRAALAALEGLRSAGAPIPVDACVPWWFATAVGDDGRPLLDTLLDTLPDTLPDTRPDTLPDRVGRRVDRVVLAAPAAQAQGPHGVLALAAPGIDALVAAGRRFALAVRTDAVAGPGGEERTFHAEGPVALLRESAVVAQALAGVPDFDGVAVDSHRAWRRLLGV